MTDLLYCVHSIVTFLQWYRRSLDSTTIGFNSKFPSFFRNDVVPLKFEMLITRKTKWILIKLLNVEAIISSIGG